RHHAGTAPHQQTVPLFGDPLAGLSDAERALAESVPAWVTGAFAVGVFAGLLGVIGLAALRKWARPLLIISLLGVLGQCGWIVLVSDAPAIRGPAGIAMPALITAIAILLAWLSHLGTRKGWLK